ncbi:MAG: zeta toxin family protein, partial [Pseudomonadota bacterium]
TNSYKEKDRYYNSRDKQLIKNPITGKEEEMTRTELHDAIIQRFIEGKEKPSETEKTLIFLATGGLPGAGKGTVLKEAVREMIDIPADTNSEHYEKYYVVVDPDAIKPYLPEYYNDDGTLNGSRVHRESGDVADMIREMALKEGYSILYDASMKDSLQFGWYTQIVNEARFQHYEPKVAFVYDGGEAWYRNSVLRDRALPADGYINFMRAYDTFFHLAQKHGIHATMYDNSSRIPRKGSPTKLVVYKDGKALYLDRNLYKNFQHFEVFRKLLLQL